ncbi:enoyl-CoA hydratase domain-containing protein 3, mitochondrial isoform X2 [Pungitius pungitius]|uniref:enoyl-CoA hydratase domain-containing protein 3, mitochondrial isoform X2 n=1 Tax=Pungitius pungitius TaxID=134920 RepID=UPI002E0D3D5F
MARSLLCKAVGVFRLSGTGPRFCSRSEPEPLTTNNLEQPQEEERSVSVHAGVPQRKPPRRRGQRGPQSCCHIRGPVFSSGHDLKELTSAQGREYHTKVFHTCAEVMTLIQDIPVPVIAMVNGVATAAGCQLVASCDVAVATEKSTFATPGVNVGLFCSTPAVAIGRAVPRKVAMEMLLTGTPISARDALLHGLISRVVAEERLEEETLAIARRVCRASRPVVALGKATFQRQMAQGRDAAYATASKVMVDNLALRDGQEGIRAFIEKRKPVWSNKAEKAHD